MSTITLGTNATTSLTAVDWNASLAVADVAAVAVLIKDDLNPAHPVWPGAFSKNGLLYVPNRGVLRVLAGDYVGVDSTTGWPVLISANAIANGPYTHS